MTMVPAVVLTTACLLVISATDSVVVNGAAVEGFDVAGGGAPRWARSGEVSSAASRTPRAERRARCMEVDYSARRSPGSKRAKPFGVIKDPALQLSASDRKRGMVRASVRLLRSTSLYARRTTRAGRDQPAQH